MYKWWSLVIALILGFIIGYMTRQTNSTEAVCHSKTEDSVITDCDYRNGVWYRK